MMNKNKTKTSILAAAKEEFAQHGFAGARMEQIAKRADINKAMLFYYFNSKQTLYHQVLKGAFSQIFLQMAKSLHPGITPEEFLESLPRVHFNFIKNNIDVIRIISFDSLQGHVNFAPVISDILQNLPFPANKLLTKLIKKWYEDDLITEPDPLHFMLNILSLTIFSFIGRPVFEKVFSDSPIPDEKFYEQRIQSVINLLKRGMLK